MSKDRSKHTVIERKEELCNVKGNHTSLEALGPARANQVGEKETSIFSRPLRDTPKLVGMKDTVLNSIKLESPGNHLLNVLAKGVEQDNRLKGLGSIVGWFARLGMMTETDSLKCRGQCRRVMQELVRERMPEAQMSSARILLR